MLYTYLALICHSETKLHPVWEEALFEAVVVQGSPSLQVRLLSLVLSERHEPHSAEAVRTDFN